MRFCGIALRHYSGESDLRLVVGVECLAVLLNSLAQMFAVDSSAGDASLYIPILDDYLEFCTHALLRYCLIGLLHY